MMFLPYTKETKAQVTMAQVKIYGRRDRLASRKTVLGDAIHEALTASLGLPQEKRFQRFILLEQEEFIYPSNRSEDYTIIEVSMFEGRSREAKQQLMRLLFAYVAARAGIAPHDVEITIWETPRANWGIRGQPADELTLHYKVEV
jgi:phenylpyruvate tautomerase PptA (4-oxalocrotonate tautomerase family)